MVRRCLLPTIVLTFGLSIVPCVGADAAKLRTWTSRDGRRSIRAELLSFDGVAVRLKKSDGTEMTVTIAKLHATDREYLALHHKADRRPEKPKAERPATAGDHDAEKEARQALREVGIRVTSSGLALATEAPLAKRLRAITDLRKNLRTAKRALDQEEQKEKEINRQMMGLTLINARLNTQLARVRPGDVTTNNRLVGAINANESTKQLFRDARQRQVDQVRSVRSKTNEIRETYIQAIIDLRTAVDSISKEYRTKASSERVGAAVSAMNKALGKSYRLVESRRLRQVVAQLKKLEATVLSESILLRRVGSGSLLVSVVIDGKEPVEMVLDSGASLITLPKQVASRCGIQVDPGAPSIVLSLADGSKISGNLVTLESVRVGKFTAKDVECAVLGAEAVNAPPLLGMSFLANFTFKVDASKGTLTMVQVK